MKIHLPSDALSVNKQLCKIFPHFHSDLTYFSIHTSEIVSSLPKQNHFRLLISRSKGIFEPASTFASINHKPQRVFALSFFTVNLKNVQHFSFSEKSPWVEKRCHKHLRINSIINLSSVRESVARSRDKVTLSQYFSKKSLSPDE